MTVKEAIVAMLCHRPECVAGVLSQCAQALVPGSTGQDFIRAIEELGEAGELERAPARVLTTFRLTEKGVEKAAASPPADPWPIVWEKIG